MAVKITHVDPPQEQAQGRIQPGDSVVFHGGTQTEEEQTGPLCVVLDTNYDHPSGVPHVLIPAPSPVWVPVPHVNLFARQGQRDFDMPDKPQPIE